MPAGNETPLHCLQDSLFGGRRRLVAGVEALLVPENMWMVAREQNWTGKHVEHFVVEYAEQKLKSH